MTAEMPGPEIREWSTEELVTDEVKDLCIQMKPDIEKKVGTHLDFYAPLTFRRLALDGGTHTLVKVYVGVDKCVHAILSVIIDANDGPYVSGFQFPKTASDPLIPFPFQH